MRMSRNMGLLSQGGGSSLTLLANGSWNPLVASKKLYTRVTTTSSPDADFVYNRDYTSGTVNVDTERTRISQAVYKWAQEMVALVLDDEVDVTGYQFINFEWTGTKNKFDVDIVPAAGVEDFDENYFDTGSARIAIEDILLVDGNTIRICSTKTNASTVCEITKIWLS